MEKIIWSEEYKLGLEPIDFQHQKLIEIFNNLFEKKSDKNIDDVKEVYYALLEYTYIHFKEEENIMLSNKFPKYDLHKKEHSYFIAQLKDIEKEIDNENLSVVEDVIIFLKKWLVNHILCTDKEIAMYINKR